MRLLIIIILLAFLRSERITICHDWPRFVIDGDVFVYRNSVRSEVIYIKL